jgi:hypothetical protein
MRWRATTWLALGLWLLAVALVAVIIVMKLAGWHGSGNTSSSGLVALLLSFIAFGTMGALVAARVPRNALGWIFLSIAILAGTSGASENYAYHALVVQPGSLPGGLAVAWLYSWGWFPTLILIVLVPLLYPTGHVLSRRWRPVLWGLIGLVCVVALSFMLYPGPLDGDKKLPDNPVGVSFMGGARHSTEVVAGICFFLFLGAVGLSVILRFRRSRGDERQQMKWMTFAVAFLVLSQLLPGILGLNGGDVLFSIAVVQLPIAVGIAMLKYRLYDVDRLINKTLVYGALTAVLGAAYFGLVLAGQAVSSSVAGGGNLAIAVSTLLVAALFLPVRSRVQRFVDRRFYRRRYDAQRTLEGFGARLREQVELETLTGELRGVVTETMQPTHVTLWLRRTGAQA